MSNSTELSGLAQRASFALRNHLSSLMALCHVLGDEGEAAQALHAIVVRIALDADVLVDLSMSSVEHPGGGATAAELLREAVAPLGWLADLVGAPVGVRCPDDLDAAFLDPREVVVTGRRLVAALIAGGTTTPLLLEARPDAGGVLIAARRVEHPLDLARLGPTPPSGNDNDVQLDVLAWALGRPGLRTELLADGDAVLAARLGPAD